MIKVNLSHPIASRRILRLLPYEKASPRTYGLIWAAVILVALISILLIVNSAQASIPFKVNRSPAQVVPKDQILIDVAQRISPDFRIPDTLQKRVGFWFDIYSKYRADDHVIHHVEYPWIVFNVVNTSSILENPNNRWSKFHKADKLVRTERSRIKKVLLKLSRLKSFEKLNEEEARFVDLLKDLPGKRAKIFRQAAQNLRSQLGQKDFILAGLATSQRYLPYIEDIFRQQGLPLEITRLPLVESSFNEAAVSKVGASGIWQLMPAMGKKFLRMTGDIDERNSPLKATEAAAKLLEQNYKILKTWPLALTAYNHGPGGLVRAQKKLKTNDITKIVEDYSSSSFGFASSNFYCSFLAVLHVEKYQRELFGDLQGMEMPNLKSVELPQSVRLKNITSALGLDADEVRIYNLDIKQKAFAKNKRLPKGYRLFVPVEKHPQLEAYLEGLPQAITQKDDPKRSRL